MASLLVSALLALASPALAAPSLAARQTTDSTTTNATVTLGPITANSSSTTTADSFTPQYNTTLPYSSSDSSASSNSLVSVGLTTTHGNVLLESLNSVVSVSCAETGDSVSIVFDSTANLEAAYSAWSGFPTLLLTTNHMGNCDGELERGFFVAESFEADADSLTLVASAEKSDIAAVASYIRTDFNGVPFVHQAKRALGDVTFSPAPLNFNTSLVLNETTLYSDEFLTAALDGGSLDLSITVGGTLVYNVVKSELESLEAYLETNTTSLVTLGLSLGIPYNKTFSYSFSGGTTTVAIPGVLSFGPTVAFAIGAEVIADAGVDVELTLGSEIYNGTVTLDYTGNLSYAGSWDPTFSVGVNVSEAAGVSVTPFVQSSFDLAFSLLNGTYNISGGIAPRSSFPTAIALDAEESVGAGASSDVAPTVTDKIAGENCTDGVEVTSVFDFALDAYVTGKWDDELLYNVSIPVLDQCLSW